MLLPNAQKIDQYTPITGNVPRFTNKFVTKFDEDYFKFASYWREVIHYSVFRLLEFTTPDVISELYENMIHMMLLLDFNTGTPALYDRRFVVEMKDRPCFRPLFPLVESVWREHLQNEFFEYIHTNEAALLSVMARSDTMSDTKDKLFECIVIQRCMKHGVVNFPLSLVTTGVAPEDTVSIPSKQHHFHTHDLPELTVYSYNDGVHVPIDSNFPAIDLIWKTGVYVFGIQIHTTSTHGDDVASLFEEKCRKAGWLDEFQDNVFLIYLCPDESCMMPFKPKNSFHQTTESGIKIGYITTKQVECLKDIQ